MDRDIAKERFFEILVEILQRHGVELLEKIDERERQEMGKEEGA